MVAAKEGGADEETNFKLRLAVDKAKQFNMPKANIERAIERGSGQAGGEGLMEAVYEGYGPGKIAVMVEVVTDNKNRAIADVRHIVNKNGGNIADSGSVAWQVTRKGYIAVSGDIDEDELFLTAADAGADDVQFDETAEIFMELEAFAAVRDAVRKAGFQVDEANVIYDPNAPVELDIADTMQVMGFIEKIEDLDDVQNVYSTLEISDEAIAQMEAD